jgi:hypothetical protein
MLGAILRPLEFASSRTNLMASQPGLDVTTIARLII